MLARIARFLMRNNMAMVAYILWVLGAPVFFVVNLVVVCVPEICGGWLSELRWLRNLNKEQTDE